MLTYLNQHMQLYCVCVVFTLVGGLRPGINLPASVQLAVGGCCLLLRGGSRNFVE